MGAVYFGALTYIGNAPNFMIKAVAEDRGVDDAELLRLRLPRSVVMLPLLAVNRPPFSVTVVMPPAFG